MLLIAVSKRICNHTVSKYQNPKYSTKIIGTLGKIQKFFKISMKRALLEANQNQHWPIYVKSCEGPSVLFALSISVTRPDNFIGIRVTSRISVSLSERSVSPFSQRSKCSKRGGRPKKGPRFSSLILRPRKSAWHAKAHAALYLFDAYK